MDASDAEIEEELIPPPKVIFIYLLILTMCYTLKYFAFYPVKHRNTFRQKLKLILK